MITIIHPNPTLSATKTPRRSFRLWRAEVYNWGTLGEDMVHGVNFEGGWVCITGRNGVGKSTLIDAITTAFPPPGERIYYNSGGAKNTKERTRLSYLQGHYGREQDESGRDKPNALRTKPYTPGAILLQFHEESSGSWVTLLLIGTWDAQNKEHWFYGTISKKLDLRLMAGKDDWESRAKRLRKEGWDITSDAATYRSRVIDLLNIPSEKALKTFVRTVGLKNIDEVNDFIRGYMLDDVSVHKRYEELTTHYKQQMDIDEEIQATKQMIELLRPLDDLFPEYQRITAQLGAREAVNVAVECRIADESAACLNSLIDAAKAELEKLEGEMKTVERSVETIQSEINVLNASEPAIRAAELATRAATLTTRRQTTLLALNELTSALRMLKIAVPTNEPAFQEMRLTLQRLIETTDNATETHGDELARRKTRVTEIEEQIRQLRIDLETTKASSSHLPREDLDRRDRIAAAVGLRAVDLPYVGELVDVDPAQSKWRVAMEKLLRTFARRMLVPSEKFEEVAKFVNGEDFGARVRMERVHTKTARFTMGDPPQNAACRKLKVKPNSPFTDWLKNSLESHFDHRCFENVAEYARCSSSAVTFEGLVKGGRGDYHEKRDDVRIRDARDHFLGWDNLEKIRSMQAELVQLSESHTQAVGNVDRQRQANRGAADARDMAKAIVANLTSYAQINMSAVNQELAKLEAERRELAKEDPDAAAAERCLAELGQHLTETQAVANQQLERKGSLETVIRGLRSQLHDVEEERPQTPADKEFAELIAPFFKDAAPVEAKGLPKWAQAIRTRNAAHFSGLLARKGDVALKMQGVMSTYISKCPTESSILEAKMDAVAAFVDRRVKLEGDKLVELEKRFHKHIEQNLALHASQLRETLQSQVGDAEKRIEAINLILADIEWELGQVVNIKTTRSLETSIRDFTDLLAKASAPLFNPTREQSTNAFEAVKKVLTFLDDEKNRKLVLDARNWLVFGVGIIPAGSDPQLTNAFRADTSGLSTGQKKKLSVTLLACALANQYQLTGATASPGTFRTVLIDEAFANLDSENARYALDLFKKFDFQLVLVHPLDGTVRVAEDYVNAFLLATIRDNKHSSLIAVNIEHLDAAIVEKEAEDESGGKAAND